MMHPRLTAIVEPGTKGNKILGIHSPGVGLFSLCPESGTWLGGGTHAGRLSVLNQSYDLVLPADSWGLVENLQFDEKVVPVEYGQVLFHLAQRHIEGLSEQRDSIGGVITESGGEATYPILSPTDGVFYLRPNPSADPYVRVGDRLSPGQPLGLVEVMKCFNPIHYGEAGLPSDAELVEICAVDGAEIKSGQVLFRVR